MKIFSVYSVRANFRYPVIVPLWYSTMSRLPCLHPGCPQTFKSQNGCTYHMHAIHINTNSRPVNVGHHISQSSQPSDGDRVAPTANNRGPINKRIEHPYLTGMHCCISWHIVELLTCPWTKIQHFHVIKMVTSCHQACCQLLGRHPCKGTGCLSAAKSHSR